MGKYSFTNEDAEQEILTKEKLLDLITRQQKTIQDIQSRMTEQQEEIDQLKQLVIKLNIEKDQMNEIKEEEHSQSKESIEETQIVKEESENFEIPE